jgi:hypothetical protein
MVQMEISYSIFLCALGAEYIPGGLIHRMHEAVGARGKPYFLGADRISVISPSGELVRKVPFTKPDRESVATKIYVSRGVLTIVLNSFKKSGSDDRKRKAKLMDDGFDRMTN